jgi:hypothetical protein
MKQFMSKETAISFPLLIVGNASNVPVLAVKTPSNITKSSGGLSKIHAVLAEQGGRFHV